MAHLEVEPKPSRPWWVWVLIVLLVFLLVGLLLNKFNGSSTGMALGWSTSNLNHYLPNINQTCYGRQYI